MKECQDGFLMSRSLLRGNLFFKWANHRLFLFIFVLFTFLFKWKYIIWNIKLKKHRCCVCDSNPGPVGADDSTELWRKSYFRNIFRFVDLSSFGRNRRRRRNGKGEVSAVTADPFCAKDLYKRERGETIKAKDRVQENDRHLRDKEELERCIQIWRGKERERNRDW